MPVVYNKYLTYVIIITNIVAFQAIIITSTGSRESSRRLIETNICGKCWTIWALVLIPIKPKNQSETLLWNHNNSDKDICVVVFVK